MRRTCCFTQWRTVAMEFLRATVQQGSIRWHQVVAWQWGHHRTNGVDWQVSSDLAHLQRGQPTTYTADACQWCRCPQAGRDGKWLKAPAKCQLGVFTEESYAQSPSLVSTGLYSTEWTEWVSEWFLNGTSAQLGYTVPYKLDVVEKI